jgi:hypothetical protein
VQIVLVWGAWREALAQAVTEHREALGRRFALVAQLGEDDAGQTGAAERDVRIGAERLAQAARGLGASWASSPWAELAARAAPPDRGSGDPLDRGPGGPLRLGTLAAADGVTAPLLVPFPRHLGGHGGHVTVAAPVRDPEVAALFQAVLLRVLATAPPGDVRVLAHDPAGLGRAFSPFQPLVETGVIEDVGPGRDGLLRALAAADAQVRGAWQHQGLRQGQHQGLRQGQHQGGAPPALVLALAGLPPGHAPDVEARLAALAHAGPSAGVSLLLADWPPDRPAGYEPPPALEAATGLRRAGDGWVVSIPGIAGGAGLDLAAGLDPAPSAALVDAVIRPLAAATAAQHRSEFADLLPEVPGGLWQESSATGLATPVGRRGRDTAVLAFDDATPHWLVGGRSGSGKTVFLQDALAGLTARYSPSELALYLLDFKEGVSFTEFTPTVHDPAWVPQAVAVGVESDREYGVAVLRALRAEMDRRADAFKRAGATGLAELRRLRPEAVLPRIVAVIDEFQVLFAGNDDLARRAGALLEDVARKGRSYGVHLVLASQTAAGIETLQTKLEAIFGQFPLRVALAGGGGVLDALNPAADGLAAGTAIVNDAAGIPGANTVVRLPMAPPEATQALRRALWERRPEGNRPPSVFAGFAERHLDDDPLYASLRPDGVRRQLLLGRYVDVGSPTAWVPIDATPGRHLAIVGPSQAGGDVLAAALAGLGRQHRPGTARFLLAPLVQAGDEAASHARAALTQAGHEAETVPLDRLADAVAALAAAGASPGSGSPGSGSPGSDSPGRPSPSRPAYLALFGADVAGPALSAVSTETFRSAADDLRAVVQQGPVHGVHVLGWWRSLSRLSADLGSTAREDIACLLALNVPAQELQQFLGRYDLYHDPRPNRALLLDRHQDVARVLVPFVRRPDDGGLG